MDINKEIILPAALIVVAYYLLVYRPKFIMTYTFDDGTVINSSATWEQVRDQLINIQKQNNELRKVNEELVEKLEEKQE